MTAAESSIAPRLMPRIWKAVRLGPLERRLFWIVFVALLPLTLLSFATLLRNAHVQKNQFTRSTEDAASAIVAAVDLELNLSFAALDVLATSPRLEERNFAAFHAEANALLKRRPSWVNVVLADPSSQQVMNARLPPGSVLPSRIDPETIAEITRTGLPRVGNVIFSPVLNTHAFAVQVPIKEGPKVAYVLTAALRPDTILNILLQQHLPERSVAVILDRRKIVVARSLNHQEWVGKHPSKTLLESISRGRPGAWTTTQTLEGVHVYTVFKQSRQTGWSVAIGIPIDTLQMPVIRSYLMLGGSILASVLLGLLAARLTGRSVTRPMRELESAAIAAGHGQPLVLPRTDLPEIRLAALALAQAHTEREKLLQSERDARRLAENASRTKDEFLAMLGHELRNPLAAISNASQLLDQAERIQSKEAADQAKTIIRRQVRHLARLTDDLLDAGRVVMGKIKLDLETVDLSRVVQSAVEMLQRTVDLSEYDFKLSVCSVWVRADIIRIDQVVANLLTNAVKYTPIPGSITVTLDRDGADAVLRVGDSGLGIEAELLPRVFDLFVQGQRSLDRSQGGLGIGLTLVKQLTELHGGRVEVRSDGPDRGSEFVIRLPAIEAPDRPLPAADHAPPAPRRRVVLVEDNQDVRTSLRCLLELEGHRVYEAVDGPSGVETILREQADVALVDIGLPLLNGYAVARLVRERSADRVRLIAMTGYGSEADIARGLRAGFDAYLIKPIDPILLNTVIAEASGCLARSSDAG